MDANEELLNFLYQNAQMGAETVEHLLEEAEGEGFRNQLEKEFKEYRGFQQKARQLLEKRDSKQKSIPEMQKMGAKLMIDLKTMTDKSPSHIAEMMIQGSAMGIIDATKKIHRYESEADPEIVALLEELCQREEENARALRRFLK